MSFWPDVKKGDVYKPSASLENHVRHFFNGSANISDGKGSLKISNGNRVRVINNTSETIGAYEPIYITGRSNAPEQLDLYVAPATQDELLWGIAANTIEANSDGAMIISGIAQAYITGTGEYASPGADGKLVAGTSGKALILHPGDDKTPGIVQLGYSADSGYNGYFKLIATLTEPAAGDETMTKIDVKIVDGATYTADGTSGSSLCYVNNRRYMVPPYHTQIELDYAIAEVDMVEYFSLQYTPENYSVSVVRHDDRHFPLNSALIGRVFIHNGTVSAVQDSYGVAQIMWFALCDDGSESESGGTAE